MRQTTKPHRIHPSTRRLGYVVAVAAVLALLVGAFTSFAPNGAGSALAAGVTMNSFAATGSAVAGQPVTFTASATTTNPGANIVAFQFNFGDGTATQVVAPTTPGATASVTTTHTYSGPGTFLAQASAVDTMGASGGPVPTAVNVSVTGQRIDATLTATPQQVVIGQPVTFSATASTPNTGGTIQNFTINFGDGTASQALTTNGTGSVSASVQHTYIAPGTFTASVTATDNMGNLGQATTSDFVAPIGTVLGANPYPYNYGYPFTTSGYLNPAPVYTTTSPYYTTPTPAYTTSAYTTSPAYSNVLGVSAINPANGISLSFPLGWSIVAGPTGTMITGNVGPLYAFRPGDTAYEVVPNGSPLQAGWGYWAYFSTPMTVVIPNVTASTQSVPLPAGQFVMIGNPGDGTATVSGADYMVTFNPTTNTYTPITQIPAGQGAWAFSFHGGTATIASS